jgi:hypothetical protein
LKATRLNSFKVRLENFYAIYLGIFRTDLVCMLLEEMSKNKKKTLYNHAVVN